MPHINEYIDQQSVDAFIRDGYLKMENAIPDHICKQVTEILWKDLDVDPADRKTWTKPVIRLQFYNQEPFRAAANMPVLINAFNQLVGEDRWKPRNNLGTFPVRFPATDDPGDTGWHVDSSFPGEEMEDYTKWRINVFSKGRGLLMLFLFSDVGEKDAPTIIKVGSHRDVARMLAPFGEQGLAFMDLANKLETLPHRREKLATGSAGTVYLCHPFLVHAAQPHHGTSPRFLAQPSLELIEPFTFDGNIRDSDPVEKAIRLALV